MRPALVFCAAVLLAVLSACGGGGGGGPSGPAPVGGPVSLPSSAQGANAVALVVDRGSDGSAIDTPFVTVTVCMPNSTTCQVVDHVMVDTGSYGLRIAASALPSTVTLPPVLAPDGGPLAECANFVSGFAWGSVRKADVKIGGETALDVPIQVVKDPAPAYASVPTSCSSTGAEMGVGVGAKGILGVGFLRQDCGSACVNSTAPEVYFSCPTSGCVSSTAPLASQVTNPVTLFATDNNGVVISLPDVPVDGASQATGSLVFGIGTQSNNQIASPTQVFTTSANGDFTTTYKGQSLTGFIDSGSNGIFFHDATIPKCSSGFYCPSAPLGETATVTGANGATRSISFTVEAPPAGAAAADLAGDLGLTHDFDWGLPFFFNRKVYQAFQGANTPFGTGPYYAF
jgi:hypothetical protein